MGTALPFIQAAGTAFSFLGSMQKGKAESQAATYNAQVATNNAEMSRQNAEMAAREGDANAAREQQKNRAVAGSIKANQAASGIDVNRGSAVDVQSSAAELGMLNAISIRSNAARRAYGYQTQATGYEAQAELDRAQAKNAKKAGMIEGAGTLLSGGADLYNNYLSSSGMNSMDGTVNYDAGETYHDSSY